MSARPATDFIDDDLRRSSGSRPDLKAAEQDSRRELGELTRQRERLEDEVSGTARELERLRQQQENLLKRKQSLETLRQRQDRYVEEKQDLAHRVHQCLLMLDKEEVRVAQLHDLYTGSREVFARLEAQLNQLGEGGWRDEDFDRKLTESGDAVQAARLEFKKTLARLDALDWTSAQPAEGEEGAGGDGSFGYWLKAGLAFGLPVSVLLGLTALAVLWILTNTPWAR